jgi:hypothetical protein
MHCKLTDPAGLLDRLPLGGIASRKNKVSAFYIISHDLEILHVYRDSAIYKIYLDMTGMLQRSLQIVIHGFVF